MRVILERDGLICDHCGVLAQGISLLTEFAETTGDRIQLCDEHAKYFAREMLKEVNHEKDTV